MSLTGYFRLRKARSLLKQAIKSARTIYAMQRDVVPAPDVLAEAIEAAKQVLRTARTAEEVEAGRSALEATLGPDSGWRPLHPNSLAENFEVLVVAIGVAMAFRCYFLEPFKIPTGSMQPTLYGIYSTDQAAPGFLDRAPMKYLKWLVTGDWYSEVRVSAGGTAGLVQRAVKPGYITFQVAQRLYHVPSDAVQERSLPFARKAAMRGSAASGEKIWSGIVHAGDHVFVNRVAWNFRKPRRGDVMVFATDGIEGLPQGTHYIKRMVGLPGETVSVTPPDLIVDGKRIDAPDTITRIEERAKAEHPEDGYTTYKGYMTIGSGPAPSRAPLRTPRDSIVLADDEYLGMGDNTANSYDGRYWGAVKARNLIGPGAFVYWPFTSKRFGRIR